MRLANEIENTPFSIFFTLTYNNKYIPKLQFIDDGVNSRYVSLHTANIRFNGVSDVLRDDDFTIYSRKVVIPIKNYNNDNFISYSSKSDFQLWLKLLRRDIDETFNLIDKDETKKRTFRIRYYAISEYGPTSRRAHIHGVLFAYNPQVADYLLRVSMYKNWQMCDKSLFDEYVHYCDSGASQYVTNYLTCSDSLPSIFKVKQIRPFRLSSKSPSIGFSSFDPKEIFENLFAGINEYSKTVSRIGVQYIFPYPSDFAHRLFPKCREYSLLSYQRLHYIYGFLWRNVYIKGFSYDVCNRFLREKWFPADVAAAQKAYKYCIEFGFDVDTYLYLVDMYYYKESMFALRKFYEWQELHAKDSVSLMFSYNNFEWYVSRTSLKPYEQNTLSHFLNGFGLTLDEVRSHDYLSLVKNFDEDRKFHSEVEDIIKNMEKMPKFNEKFGFAPHII